METGLISSTEVYTTWCTGFSSHAAARDSKKYYDSSTILSTLQFILTRSWHHDKKQRAVHSYISSSPSDCTISYEPMPLNSSMVSCQTWSRMDLVFGS
jgi:hypothetical protein